MRANLVAHAADIRAWPLIARAGARRLAFADALACAPAAGCGLPLAWPGRWLREPYGRDRRRACARADQCSKHLLLPDLAADHNRRTRTNCGRTGHARACVGRCSGLPFAGPSFRSADRGALEFADAFARAKTAARLPLVAAVGNAAPRCAKKLFFIIKLISFYPLF